MIIDWKKISNSIYTKIKQKIETLDKKPILWVILLWDDPVSLRYINQKRRLASFVWIWFVFKQLDKNTSEDKLINTIKEFNEDRNIAWFIIQLPLPKHINLNKVLNTIDPAKDVDWFHPINMWKILIWDNSWLIPCTPAWIMELLNSLDIDLRWKNITIIWRSNIVWKPMSALLINAWATVTICNSQTKKLSHFTRNSDIVITATWKPKLLTLDMINSETIIIDVWFSIVNSKIIGDADFDNINIAWIKITPVPGWVWPLTVAMLMKNILKASIWIWKI